MIRNDGPTIIYIPFNRIDPDTRIGVSNLKDETRKSTLAKFVKNVKDILDDMYYNYTIIMYQEEHNEEYSFNIFRDLLSGKNPTFNILIKITKDDLGYRNRNTSTRTHP